MKEQKFLEREKISEIAEKAIGRFEPSKLPLVGDVAWAFPIAYGGHTGSVDGSYLNGQECNAWRALTLLNAYSNTLKCSGNGKFIQMRGWNAPPSHILFGDHIFDASHLHWPYLAIVKPREITDNTPEQIKNTRERLNKSTYWENLPVEVAKGVVRADQLMHGYDEEGNKLPKPFENEGALENYLAAVKNSLTLGTGYLNSLVQRGRRNELVLVSTIPKDLRDGDYMQILKNTENGVVIAQAYSRGINEGKLGIDFWDLSGIWKNGCSLEDCLVRRDIPVEKLKNATIWKEGE